MFYIIAELETLKKWQTPLLKVHKDNGNVEVELNYHVDPENLSSYDAIIVGAPTYHHDMPVDFKNLFEEAAVARHKFEG